MSSKLNERDRALLEIADALTAGVEFSEVMNRHGNRLSQIERITLLAARREGKEDLVLRQEAQRISAYEREREMKQKHLERWAAFIIGVIFVAIAVALVFTVSALSDTQYKVIRILLALGAGGFGLFLGGVLELKSGLVRAGGAMALVVLMFLWDPAGQYSETPPPSPDVENQEAEPQAS
ncbi:MAG: hypothetical protein K0U98_11475 [Deltaproteobacteria bacterium]|nr:hypothetical protein [Deltaproteobacteria bacterium]